MNTMGIQRVVLLVRSLPLHRSGGLEFHAWDLAHGLAACDIDVHVVTTGPPPNFDREKTDAGIIDLHFLPQSKPGKYSAGTFGEFSRVAMELTKEVDRAIIHAQGFAGFSVKPPALKTPFVATIHGTLFSETPLYRDYWKTLSAAEKLSALWRMKHRFFVMSKWKAMLQRADALLVDSNFTRRELEHENRELSSKIYHVPLGVSFERFREIDKKDARKKLQWCAPTFLSVGRLERMKGLHIAIEALAALKNRDWKFVVVGEGNERPALESLAKNLKVEDRIVFAGRVKDDVLPEYFAAADVFVNPELSQPAFGLVALESLLQGTPVMANRAGAVPEIVGGSGGELINDFSVNAWRVKLSEWLDGKKWQNYDPAALRADAKKRFAFDAMIDGTLKVYEKVLNQKGNL